MIPEPRRNPPLPMHASPWDSSSKKSPHLNLYCQSLPLPSTLLACGGLQIHSPIAGMHPSTAHHLSILVTQHHAQHGRCQ